MRDELVTMSLGKLVAEKEVGGNEEVRAQRRHQFLGRLLGVATVLTVMTVLFFAFYDRAELQFLFSKPVALNGSNTSTATPVAPDNALAQGK